MMNTLANVYLLPTDTNDKLKSDQTYLSLNDGKLFNPFKNEYYHLYITLPQSGLEIAKIKDGDYCIDGGELFGPYENGDISIGNFEKIIATTDSSLIQDSKLMRECFPYSLHSIPQQFTEYFISEYNIGNIIKTAVVELDSFIPNNGCNLNDGYHFGLELNQQNEISIVIFSNNQKLYTKQDLINVLVKFEKTQHGTGGNVEHLIKTWMKKSL